MIARSCRAICHDDRSERLSWLFVSVDPPWRAVHRARRAAAGEQVEQAAKHGYKILTYKSSNTWYYLDTEVLNIKIDRPDPDRVVSELAFIGSQSVHPSALNASASADG